jgi:hypothetical protein
LTETDAPALGPSQTTFTAFTVDQKPAAFKQHGSLNVPIEHHPTIRYMVYNGYYKVMSNIPKMGQLPTPEKWPNFQNK